MAQKIECLFKKLDKLFHYGAALTLGLMLVFIILQVFFRFVISRPLAWTEELARFMFIWMTFIAGYIAARKGDHVSVQVLAERLPSVWGRILRFITNGLTTIFFAVIAYYCITLWPKLHMQTSAVIQIPMSFVYLGMIIGCVLMALWFGFTAIQSLFDSERSA